MFVADYNTNNNSGRCNYCGSDLRKNKSNDIILLKYQNAKLVEALEKINKIKEFGLANEPWFVQLSKSMKRYGVDWTDLQEGNVGIDMKTHTLKIIDASVFSRDAGEKDWN